MGGNLDPLARYKNCKTATTTKKRKPDAATGSCFTMASPTTVPRGRSPAPSPTPQPGILGSSEFRARASSPLTTTAPPPVASTTFPGGLLMLVDRTSFDETESFGVDAIALESSSYRDSLMNAQPSQGVIMRNGKVRRRLKWRPKSMMKPKRRPPLVPPSPPSSMQLSRARSSFPSPSASLGGGDSNRHLSSVEKGGIPDVFKTTSSPSNARGNTRGRVASTVSASSSSNASVNSSSNASDASKQSRRSLHSFASVETQVKSNTTKSLLALRAAPSALRLKHQQRNGSGSSAGAARGRKFPLPRPNYSTTLDGVSTHETHSSSSTSSASSTSTDHTRSTVSTATSTTTTTATPTTTTISNEGQVLMMMAEAGGGATAELQQRPRATVFEAADCVLAGGEDDDEEPDEPKNEDNGNSTNAPPSPPRGATIPKSASSRGSLFLSPSSSSSFRPPLFKSKSTTSGRGGSGTTRKSTSASSTTTKPSPQLQQPASSLPRSSSVPKQLDPTNPHRLGTSSTADAPSLSSNGRSTPPVAPINSDDGAHPKTAMAPIPTLSGEEVERERRVDLRVRQTSSSSSSSTRALRSSTPPPPVAAHRSRSDSSRAKMDLTGDSHLVPEDHDGTSIEVVNGPASTPQVVTEQPVQNDTARNAAAPTSFSARQAYTLIRTASSRLSGRSQRSLASSQRNVDPVIGPSFSTRVVLDEADLDTESLAPSLDGDESTWEPRSRSSPLLGTSSSGVSRQSPTNAPIPEIRFPVPDLAATPETSWNHEEQIPNNIDQDRDSAPLARLRKSDSAASTSVSPRTVPTVPVDLDDCSFLEAEKNLQAIHDMAAEHLQQGEYDEALEVFEEILRGQLTRYGTDHFRVATALHNIGVVHMRRGDFVGAAHAYREAIAIRRRALSPDHPDVAASLAQLGVAYLERRQHKKAIAAFRESLKIRRKCLGSTHPKVAKILNNIGCALYELNALDVAQVAFEEALDIQRMNLRQEPALNQAKSNFSLLSLASTLCNIASIKLYFGRTDEASVDFQEALLVQQCVFGDDHPIPRQTEESLRWIESTRGRDRQPGYSDTSDTSDSSYQGNLGILSRLFRRSGGGSGGGGDASAGLQPDECARFDTSFQSGSPGLLTCAVRDDARDVFGTVEERLVRLQDKIERACGPPAPAVFDYDDDSNGGEDDDEGYDSDFDIVDEEFENFGSSRTRRVVDV